MSKSATDVLQQILFATVMDAVEALKKASKGLPNNLLRDLNALHVNAAYADAPAELRDAIEAGVRTAFQKLQKEGYSVTPVGSTPPRPAGPRPPMQHRPRHPGGGGDRPGPRGPRAAGGGDTKRGPRPPRPDRDKS